MEIGKPLKRVEVIPLTQPHPGQGEPAPDKIPAVPEQAPEREPVKQDHH